MRATLVAPPSSGRFRDERGQATVELALVLPFVALLLLAVVQVGVVGRAQVLVTHAAREGARAAAVDADPGAAAAAARAGAGGLDPDRLRIDVSGRAAPGGQVTVRATYRVVTDVPLVGPLVSDVAVSASATMRVER